MTAPLNQRVAVGDLQSGPLARRVRRLRARRLVRHGDRFAEMGDRLLERRAAERLVASLAPPFDGEVIEAGLGEVMRNELRLRSGVLRIVPQDFGGAAVQRLAAALEQAVVGGVLDQRVLEAIGRLVARAFGDENVGLGEFFQRGLQGGAAVAAL